MKKLHFKTKLVLNTQTIRRLEPTKLEGVQGGRLANPDTEGQCVSVGCRACG